MDVAGLLETSGNDRNSHKDELKAGEQKANVGWREKGGKVKMAKVILLLYGSPGQAIHPLPRVMMYSMREAWLGQRCFCERLSYFPI
jgi:hypothetical protein